jgi:hypothetical protein
VNGKRLYDWLNFNSAAVESSRVGKGPWKDLFAPWNL